MAHVSMDIDSIESDYEDKENSILHSNVLSRTPCTEKGYEELDISELNMKLRYSITPASSPMSRSFTANSRENKNIEDKNIIIGNACHTSSFNSTLTSNDSYNTTKISPLQSLSTDQLNDTNRNVLMCKSFDNDTDNNITITVSDSIDENFSIPSTSSSIPHTPEATTPTKEPPKDGGSPIMRGLRSVLSIFRPSQSPSTPHEQPLQGDVDLVQSNIASSTDESILHRIEVSTPLLKTNRNSPKRNSPLKDSLIFKDDLEKELQWKDESTVLFKDEKIPKHELLLPESVVSKLESNFLNKTKEESNKTFEYMDIPYKEFIVNDKTMTDVVIKATANIEASALESDGEFVDCETTYSKDEIKSLNKTNEKELKQNESKDTDLKSCAIQNSIYVGNDYSLNETVAIEFLSKSEEVKDIIDRSETKEELIDVKNDTISYNDNLHQIENNSLMSSKDRSLCVTELPVNSEISLCESKVTEETSVPINCNNITSIIAINDTDSEKDSLAKNTNISIQNITEHVNMEFISECHRNDAVTSCTVDKSFVGENKILNDNNIFNHSNIEEIESEITNIIMTLDNAKLEENETAENGDNLVENDQETPTNSTIEVLNKDDLFDVHQEMVNDESFVTDNEMHIIEDYSEGNSNLSFENEHNKTQNLNLDTTSLVSNNSNVTNNVSLESNEDNKDSILYNENRYFRTSIETVIPPLETVKYSDKEHENNQTFPVTIDDMVICQNSLDFGLSCQDNISETSTVKQNQDILENPDCTKENILKHLSDKFNDSIITYNTKNFADIINTESKQNEKLPTVIPLPTEDDLEQDIIDKCSIHLSEKLNDSQITYDINNCVDIINTESKHDEKLHTDIPLPSDDELEQDVIDKCNITYNNESQLKTDSDNYINNQNTIPKTCEKVSDILRTTVIENVDSIINQIGELNNQDSESAIINVETEFIENLIISNEFGKNNTSEVINEANLNNCGLHVEEASKSGIINPLNSNMIDDMNIDKIQIKSSSEQSLNIINKADVNELNIKKNEISSDNSSISNSACKMEINSVTYPKYEVLNPFKPKSNLQLSPPLSPLINKKGYDINFDDINDPFATKTKIRQSPTQESPTKISYLPMQDSNIEKSVITPKRNSSKNRRKSQPLRKSVNTKKNSLNATFEGVIKKDSNISNVENDTIVLSDIRVKKQEGLKPIADGSANMDSCSFNKSGIIEQNEEDEKNTNEIDNFIEIENLCEKNKDVNLSLNHFTEPLSLRDMAKSVFNCPEINDVKFRSFSDMQRIASSNSIIPSANLTANDEETSKCFSTILNKDAVESMQAEVKHEKEPLPNIINDTSLSRIIDNDITREVNTEDEDTVTFIEMEELVEQGNLKNDSHEKDVMEFDVPVSAIDSENIDNGELFIDAEAFEFLLNQNKSNIIADSGKESLFLKFDPLFAKRVSSDGIVAALKKLQNNQSTPKKLTKLQLNEVSAIPGPSKLETTFDDGNDDASVQAMSKPMMVVNPAVNSIVSPRKVTTPKINRQSLTFTSPAIAVIDRLLSLSGTHAVADQNTPATSAGRQPNETDAAITQLREMLADKEIHVHNLRSESKELQGRLSNLEAQVKTLETESADRLRKVNDLSDRLVEKTKMNKSMAIVVEEYERTIASLITQMEQEKKNNAEERRMLIKERDEQTAHLASMEVSFSDLHSKYEKSKQIIYSMKTNEDTYRKSIKEFDESLVKMQNNYELLKQHATSKLNHANQELEKFNRAHEADILKLNALIKRKELHITSLEETLAQKTKANEELTAICDELINKVG